MRYGVVCGTGLDMTGSRLGALSRLGMRTAWTSWSWLALTYALLAAGFILSLSAALLTSRSSLTVMLLFLRLFFMLFFLLLRRLLRARGS